MADRLGSQKHILEDLWPQDLGLGMKQQKGRGCGLLDFLSSGDTAVPPLLTPGGPLQMLQYFLLDNLQD